MDRGVRRLPDDHGVLPRWEGLDRERQVATGRGLLALDRPGGRGFREAPALSRIAKPSPTLERFASIRHPRTALGLRKDGTLVILVADGRRERAQGFTGPEMSEILLRERVVDAINLDGGGSTTLYIEAEGGIQNQPSDGHERVVVNQLGFRLKPRRGSKQP